MTRLVIFSLILVGCGHPASEQECEEIFTRSAEIELRAAKVNDPAEIQKRTNEARAAMGEQMMKECVGKRITESAMKCVRQAATAEDLDRCLR